MAKNSSIVAAYLILYNLASCVGWGWVCWICLNHIYNDSLNTLWNDVQFVLKIVQTAACLEVVHSIVGFVKSPWSITFLQVFSRVWTLWAVMDVSPDAQTSIFFFLACFSWSLVEVPRYLFYALNLLDSVPYPIFWLRYSLFAILYPTGITGELGCMYKTALYLYETKKFVYHPIPEVPAIEVSLLLLIVLIALTYIPGSPTMYGHMLKTRRKQFSESKENKNDKNIAKKAQKKST